MIKINTCILRGEPIKVGERELIPEARLSWRLQRRATFGSEGNLAYGWAVVRLAPTALIEQHHGRTRRIPVRNQTHSLLLGLVAGALLLPFLMEWVIRLARPAKN
ncbi:MAG: hypothetical protein JW850_18170 [Thermoflexales bacterium]|nr:hypothetical protein [Thermoflexales bacterium]